MQASGIFRRLTLMFTSGLLVILPLAGTVYLLRYVYLLVNGWGLALLPENLRFPGLGLVGRGGTRSAHRFFGPDLVDPEGV